MERKPDSPTPTTPLSLKEVMLKARMKARAEAPPVVAAQKLSQVRLREVFGDMETRFSKGDILHRVVDVGLETHNVELKPTETGGYAVTVPSLPGCETQGENVDDALLKIVNVIRVWLASIGPHGRE